MLDVPDNYKNKVEPSDIYEGVLDFYSHKSKTVKPFRYKILSDNLDTTVDTILGSRNFQSLEVSGFSDTGKRFSNYSPESLNQVGIDTKNTWNGRMAAVNYRNRLVEHAETDYYTCTLFSRLLQLESAFNDVENMRIRQNFASDIDQFSDRPWFTTGGSIGGLIMGRFGDQTRILLGERSSNAEFSPGRFSVTPNTTLKPQTMDGNGLTNSARKAFNEEVKGYNPTTEDIDAFNVYNIINGWNLRDTKFTIHNLYVIKDKEAYYDLKDRVNNMSNQMVSIFDVDIKDPTSVAEYTKFEHSSPSVTPLILESVIYASEELGINLGYDVVRLNK